MKKNKPLIIAAAIIVLGVGFYLLMSGRNKQSMDTTETGSTDIASEEKTIVEKFTGSLKEAIALGVGMKCSYEFDGNQYEGYVKGENYRGKMVNTDGQVGEIIMKDNCMWTWSEDEGQGIKTCFEEVDGQDTEEGEESVSIWDQKAMDESGISYTCVPSSVADSQFTPPSNINFMDIDSMMQGFDN
ncbi:hypothetical protein JXA63_03375 [Candidatus Woesebacteria bacterium]|nr:hypothetical protein [Candidatus Woesebacteria bacterium]